MSDIVKKYGVDVTRVDTGHYRATNPAGASLEFGTGEGLLSPVELLLAGFFDDPAVGGLAAVAGPSAAEESLRGARLAEERGWTAPPVPDEGGSA